MKKQKEPIYRIICQPRYRHEKEILFLLCNLKEVREKLNELHLAYKQKEYPKKRLVSHMSEGFAFCVSSNTDNPWEGAVKYITVEKY